MLDKDIAFALNLIGAIWILGICVAVFCTTKTENKEQNRFADLQQYIKNNKIVRYEI